MNVRSEEEAEELSKQSTGESQLVEFDSFGCRGEISTELFRSGLDDDLGDGGGGVIARLSDDSISSRFLEILDELRELLEAFYFVCE